MPRRSLAGGALAAACKVHTDQELLPPLFHIFSMCVIVDTHIVSNLQTTGPVHRQLPHVTGTGSVRTAAPPSLGLLARHPSIPAT